MERKYELFDDGAAKGAAWMIGLLFGVIVSFPVGFILSFVTGVW